MKEISAKQIGRIRELDWEIFEEEDSDYPDRRVTTPKYIAIERILESITDDEEEQRKILEICSEHHPNDYTYKPICNKFRELGYIILE